MDRDLPIGGTKMKRLVALLMTFMLLFQKASAETVHWKRKYVPEDRML